MTWFELLAQAVAEHPRGRAGVAEAMCLSRAAISLVLAGKYPASTAHIADRVLDTYARVDCPHLAQTIIHAECRGFAERSAPTNSPLDMRHWRACQRCSLKPAVNHPESGDPHA